MRRWGYRARRKRSEVENTYVGGSVWVGMWGVSMHLRGSRMGGSVCWGEWVGS